jgi:DNA-binding NarL/FixJ family response regulator
MPLLDGIGATERIVVGGKSTKVLVITTFDLGASVYDALRAGASPREREVLLEPARGRSNREISAELHIAVETVKTHAAEILRKLGLRDRIRALVFAYEKGLVFRGD